MYQTSNIINNPIYSFFLNKEACPRSASEKLWKKLIFGGLPYILGVKYIYIFWRGIRFSRRKQAIQAPEVKNIEKPD